MKLKISSVIITYNEERNIGDCLESLKWTSEIIIVDAFSSDRTVGIARVYTDKILQREWQGYSQQRNFGLSQASNEWVLFIDADERLSNALSYEIIEAITNDSGLYDGYYMPRQSFYLGRWITHGEWHPDLKLRLIKKDKGRWSGQSVHEIIILNGKARRLKNSIYHYPYVDISHHLEKFNRYSSLFAQDAFKKNEKFKFHQLLWRTFIRFIKAYFLKRGFRDGFAGFVIAVLQSFDVFLRYAKLYELEKKIYNE